MSGSGQWRYLTGGTTAVPKQISYTMARWRRSVAAKQELMRRYGVGPGDRVAVCLPFAPWAIGQVFAEGAVGAGATVLPLGLDAGSEPFLSLLIDFAPTHVCGGAGLMLRWGELAAGRHSRSVRAIFVAGEKLSPASARAIKRLWGGDAVDVYGMAEFDMVGAELPGERGLCLVRHLHYRLLDAGGAMHRLSEGAVGQLIISGTARGPWHVTKDRVRILGRADHWGNGSDTFSVEFVARVDGAVNLSDGSMLSPAHVTAALASRPELCELQAIVRRKPTGDELEVLYVAAERNPAPVLDAEVLESVLSAASDLQDSVRHGVVTAISARAVRAGDLHRTPRGKVPLVWLAEPPP